MLAAGAWLAGCASYGGNEVDPVQARLNALEAENASLREALAEQRRRLEGLSAVGLDNSIATLEEDLRQLRGQVEQLEYQSEVDKERQRALYVDLDQRLQALEARVAGDGDQAGGAAAGGTDNGDQEAYLAAFQKLKNSDYSGAISGFRAFLGEFPDSPYAPNAQYWIGEAHYVQREFDAAWDAFGKVLERYPQSPKAADALLKQGLVRVEQGRLGPARELLEKTLERFPNSGAAELARERLAQLDDGA